MATATEALHSAAPSTWDDDLSQLDQRGRSSTDDATRPGNDGWERTDKLAEPRGEDHEALGLRIA